MKLANDLFAKFKASTFGPIFKFFKSERGNRFIKNSGPYIVIFFYFYQLLHLVFFIFHHWDLLIQNYYEIFGRLVYVSF